MQRGPKPKTVEEHKARGNPSKRPLTTLVPEPMAGAMLCPREVASDGRAQDYWDMFLSNTAPGHLRPLDAPMLARLCMSLSMADKASEEITKTGLLVKARNGIPMQNPYLPILNKQVEIARKLAAELALPPAMRNRVGKYEDGKGGPSAWDALSAPVSDEPDGDDGPNYGLDEDGELEDGDPVPAEDGEEE